MSKSPMKCIDRDSLGEAVHVAFRKGSDHPSAGKIWSLIREMPDEEWRSVLDFMWACMWRMPPKKPKAEGKDKP
jgi:hypothetical protein